MSDVPSKSMSISEWKEFVEEILDDVGRGTGAGLALAGSRHNAVLQEVAEGTASFMRYHMKPLLAAVRKPRYEERVGAAIAETVAASTPPEMTREARQAFANFLLWVFVADDCVEKAGRVARWLPSWCFTSLLDEIATYCLQCWDAGDAAFPPEAPTFEKSLGVVVPLAWLFLSSAVRRVTSLAQCLGQSLHACSAAVREVLGSAPPPTIRAYLEASFTAMRAEAQGATDTPEAYVSRHTHTNMTRPCLELCGALYMAGTGAPAPPCVSSRFAEAILYANELAFLKDVGEEEEALVAVLLGEPGECRTGKAHGEVLLRQAHTEAGFEAAAAVFRSLRVAMHSLADACCGADPAWAEVALHGVVGHYAVVLSSARYRALPVVRSLLDRDFEAFAAAVKAEHPQQQQAALPAAPAKPGLLPAVDDGVRSLFRMVLSI